MGELAKEAGKLISEHIPATILIVIFIFCIFFEISKIKIYPLKWLWKLISWPFKKVDEQRTNSFKNIVNAMKADLDNKMNEMMEGTASNCEVLKGRFDQLETRFDTMETRFDELDTKQDSTDERLDRMAAARIKNHVLNFARQCRKGESHSHEDFANLMKENKEYEALVKKYGWENDVYKHDFEYTLRVYDEHNNNGDF